MEMFGAFRRQSRRRMVVSIFNYLGTSSTDKMASSAGLLLQGVLLPW